LSYEDV